MPAGALVISLDFELHWGIRELVSAESRRDYFLRTRDNIPRVLQLFERYGIRATWATVGMLLNENRVDFDKYKPEVLPAYERAELNPYHETIGESETQDPFHYALSLARIIAATPGQELGTHTWSHYYCLENGQDTNSFRADLQAATSIAMDKGFSPPRSIVFPRNQYNPEYQTLLLEAGVRVYRGNQNTWFHRAENFRAYKSSGRKLLRLIDYFLPVWGHHTYSWPKVEPSGLTNIPASMFFWTRAFKYPFSRRLHLWRIRESVKYAAQNGLVYHLWWHPHNFGANPDQCLRALEEILQTYDACRKKYGMRSLNMGDFGS